MAKQKLKVLVLCNFQGKDANVIRDYLYAFNQFSQHEFYYLHSWRNNQCQRMYKFDFNRFDVIVFFWDCCWLDTENMLSPFYLPSWVVERISSSTALKVQFLQDEYREVRKTNHIMARFGINLMFTCVAEQDHELFYPRNIIPSLQGTYTVLTGYVPAYLERIHCSTDEPRSVDIGYRSRAVPYHLGSLAQEKCQIAKEFSRIGKQYGFSTDISVREEDRLYGEKWLEFLKSSRFSLGTESGASVVDWNGQICLLTQKYLQANPAATFEEVKERFFPDVDGKVVIQTISPRIFEAAAFQNTLVLHEGAYAGIVQPDVHFISVKKDYSNVDEVVARMRDQAFCHRLAEKTHADLIQSGKFSYRSFVKQFDEVLCRHRAPSPNADASRVLFYARNYLNQDCIIPRAGAYYMMPNIFDLIQVIKGSVMHRVNKSLDVFLVFISIQLILRLLASCDGLRQRLLEAIRNREHDNFTLSGLARDLRILALLNSARHRKHEIGPAFVVQVEWNAGKNSLLFRSLPCANGHSKDRDATHAHDKKVLRSLQQVDEIHSLQWNHGEIGDSFILSYTRGRFFLIFINPEMTYSFENLRGLFHHREPQAIEALTQVLFKPMGRNWFGQAWFTLQLCWSFAIGYVLRKPLGLLRKIMGKERAAKMRLEMQESSS